MVDAPDDAREVWRAWKPIVLVVLSVALGAVAHWWWGLR